MKCLISLLLAICVLLCFSACESKESGSDSQNCNSESSEGIIIDQSKSDSIHTHKYSKATCTSPKTCSCGKTAGVPLEHSYTVATCTSPSICIHCGNTNGDELGHDYSEPTCYKPKICNRCNQASGKALGHDYKETKCTRCGAIDPKFLPVSLNDIFIIDSYKYEYKSGAFTDAFGNTYDGVHYFTDLYQANNGRAPHSIFNINGDFKSFSGSIVASTATNPDWTYYINIYVDDALKFSKTGFSKVSGQVDFQIDVTNGEVLRITVGKEGPMGDTNQEIGIVNAQLTRQ